MDLSDDIIVSTKYHVPFTCQILKSFMFGHLVLTSDPKPSEPFFRFVLCDD